MSDLHEAPKNWPEAGFIFDSLQDLIGYGKEILWKDFNAACGISEEKKINDWNMLSKWIEFKKQVESYGYLLTEKGMNERGFRILMREEMVDVVRRREMGKANDTLMKSITLSKVDMEGLSEDHKRAIAHWETKCAVVGATAKVLLGRRTLPSPEMVVKSIKQIGETT